MTRFQKLESRKNIKIKYFIMSQLKNLFLLIICVGLLNSCYSFTGSSLTDEKTVQINEFPNNSALVNPTLSQQFSTDIQNRFVQRTTLKGTKQNPDILIEGEITDYSITPTTISSTTQNTSAGVIQDSQNKLTITVKVHYENKLHPDVSFDRTYSDCLLYTSDAADE